MSVMKNHIALLITVLYQKNPSGGMPQASVEDFAVLLPHDEFMMVDPTDRDGERLVIHVTKVKKYVADNWWCNPVAVVRMRELANVIYFDGDHAPLNPEEFLQDGVL